MSPNRRQRADFVSAALGEYLEIHGYPVIRFDSELLEQFNLSTGKEYDEKMMKLLAELGPNDSLDSNFRRTPDRLRGADVLLTQSFLLALASGRQEVRDLLRDLFMVCRSLNVTTPDLEVLYKTILSVWKEIGADFSGLYPPQMPYTIEAHLFSHIERLIESGVQQIPMTPLDFLRGTLPNAKLPPSVIAVMRSKQVTILKALGARRCGKRWEYWTQFYSYDRSLASLTVMCPSFASDPNHL